MPQYLSDTIRFEAFNKFVKIIRALLELVEQHRERAWNDATVIIPAQKQVRCSAGPIQAAEVGSGWASAPLRAACDRECLAGASLTISKDSPIEAVECRVHSGRCNEIENVLLPRVLVEDLVEGKLVTLLGVVDHFTIAHILRRVHDKALFIFQQFVDAVGLLDRAES